MSLEDKNDDANFNVYVGAETGVLKGVCFGEETPILKNFMTFGDSQKPPQIRDLLWDDKEIQKDLLVAFVNRTVKVYNSKLRAFTQELQLNVDDSDSPLVCLAKHESNFLVGLENGKVCMWNLLDAASVLDIQTGDHLAKIRQCPSNSAIFASGGKENDLKIWDLNSEKPQEPIFKAKNVPHVLELRVPVWIQDLTFLPQTTDLVAVTSRHGFVRLYDTKVNNKNRPVTNMTFCDHPVMCISPTRNDRQIIVGSAQGKVGLVDIRNYGKEKVVHMFHGFNGSVRSIVADENTHFFASCGLDRHLYLHNLNDRKPVKKLYLKSRLNCLTITKNFLLEKANEDLNQSVWHNIDMDVLPTPKKIIEKSSSSKKRIKLE